MNNTKSETLKSKRGSVVQAFRYKEKEDKEYEITIAFVVSKYRKRRDKELVNRQVRCEELKKTNFSRYAQSLFDSCFKNW